MSEMHFAPIPTEINSLYRLRHLWGPFVSGIAKRSVETEQEILDQIISGHVQIGLVLLLLRFG